MNTCPDCGCETAMVLCYKCQLEENEREAATDALAVLTNIDLWNALRETAPGATGKLSSEAFVRQKRDEWDR